MFVYLAPIDQITSDETFMAQAGRQLFGAVGSDVMAALVVLCVLGSMAAILMLSPRVYYAMARDGLFFRSVAEVHPRFGTPARAISIQAILGSLMVVLGTFSQIVAYFAFVAVAFLALTVAGIFRLNGSKRKNTGIPVLGYPFTPLAFLALVALMLFLVGWNAPLQALLGVIVILAGVRAFRLVQE